MSVVGRKSKYHSHIQPYLKQIKIMYMQGASDIEIYTKYKISKDAFYNYKKKFKEFDDCFSCSDDDMVKIATEGLMTLASGKTYEEVSKGFNTNMIGDKSPFYKVTEKWLPPNQKACEQILQKKAPKIWGDVDLLDEEEEDFYDLDNIKVVDKFSKWFHEEYSKPKYLYHVLNGGRGSGKSTTVARRFIKEILMLPINILVVRKVHSSILESCYEELKQAINDLGVEDEFKCVGGNKPYILRKRTGQKFIFRGGDKPEKIKSIKTSKYPIARLWIEEPTEFKTWEEIEVIVNSVVRAELPDVVEGYKVVLTYNPPKRKSAWPNEKYNTELLPDNILVHTSTSFDNPYMSEEFRKEAEEVKKENLKRYEWIYLGKPMSGGIVPFSNLEFRAITESEIKTFDNICQGIDWGFAVDPVHFIRAHFDKRTFTLYLMDEIRSVKMSNYKLAQEIIKRKYNDVQIIADSAEPKSVDDLRNFGCRCIGAKKGPGSVEHGLEWLDSLKAIVIDPKRTPYAYKEFKDIDYKVGQDGETLPVLEDKNDHSIDCCRYLTERFQNSKRKFF